jgi:hypothetical protein
MRKLRGGKRIELKVSGLKAQLSMKKKHSPNCERYRQRNVSERFSFKHLNNFHLIFLLSHTAIVILSCCSFFKFTSREKLPMTMTVIMEERRRDIKASLFICTHIHKWFVLFLHSFFRFQFNCA